MTIIEHAPGRDDILDFLDDGVRQLIESGSEAKYVVMGSAAYEIFRAAMAARYRREPIAFGTYNYLPIILDPARDNTACVLPAPGALVDGVQLIRTTD